MDIDTPTQPAQLNLAHAEGAGQIDGMYKLDDFLSMHKPEYDPQMLAREAVKASNHASQASKKVIKSENVAPLELVAVGARSSKHIILLHEKYQALGIPQPLFKYAGASDEGWTVEVSFPGLDVPALQGLKEEGVFNSKQEAKEATSKTAFAVLEELEKEGKVKKANKATRKSISAPVQQQEKKEKEIGPNYVGQLLEFQRSTGGAQPTYTDYSSGNRFACLVSIDGQPEPFGSLESLHSSKKDARQGAARYAVEFFKAQGTWPELFTSVGGIKKKKPQPTMPETTPPGPDGRQTSIVGTLTNSPGTMSYAQQVAQLAVLLSLPTPEWVFTPSLQDKDFHSVSCIFKNGGPHAGPIGEVRNIFGKKKAKEECARLTLQYLKEVREERLSYGVKIMEGISGGEGMVQGATDRAVEGEKEAVEARRQFVKELDGESSDEEEVLFEDAVEVMRT